MAGLDLTNLSPADAVAALRSYPRRFRAVLVPLAEDPTVADRLARVGPDGRSALDITADVARTIVLLDGALAQALVHDDAVLHPAVTDAAARHWDGAPADLDGTLVLLDDGCAAMADRAEQASSAAWYRTSAVAVADQPIETFDLLREAVRVGGDGLRAVERTLAAVR